MRRYITPEDYENAKKNGINETLLYGRVHYNGWSIDRAVKTPKRQYNNRKKWIEIAKRNGIKRETFYTRVNEHNMSPEEASTRKVGK